MNDHVSAGVPAVGGIDLTFRPLTYFGPVPLQTHVLARVMGQHRREALRSFYDTGVEPKPAWLAASTLDDDLRAAIGNIHPALMGGEYLPALRGNETEIARISLASTTADQISVRVQLNDRRHIYRIIDEYENEYTPYQCQPNQTDRPLNLAELVAMLDGACAGGGAVMSHIIGSVMCEGAYVDELRDFVQVRSEFYLQLRGYYDRRIEDWFDAHAPRADADPGCDDPD